MKRDIYKKLLDWKRNKNRKPLIIDGARQVGKTWIIKEFGTNEYKSMAYINCDKTTEMKNAFKDFNIERLIRIFSAISNVTIKPDETLIILDEVQEVPLALTALKYFYEDAPEYHIIVAGSLLGISLHGGSGFPVGKVHELKMYPMSFGEFIAAGGNEMLVSYITEHNWNDLNALSGTLEDLLRQYYYVGGMPEVVSEYISGQDFKNVRDIQNRILRDYERDFSKHLPSEILPKVIMVWNSIPAQLSKENKKFIYGALKKGSRAKDFEDAIQWLINAGLLYKIPRIKKVERPLKFYEDFSAFKLFISDLGLLGAMSDVTAREVFTGENYFSEYKGAFTEQYVAQEMIVRGLNPYYYSRERSTLEIDFVIQKESVYPIEVKAEENLRSKSLKTLYMENDLLKPVRFSMSGYREQDWMTNVPLYLAGEWIQSVK